MTTIIGTSASELLEGGSGDDYIEDTLGGSDTLKGDDGNDSLVLVRGVNSTAGVVRLEGGAGNDDFQYSVLNATTGSIDAGSGDDRIVLVATGAGLSITTGSGIDTIVLDPLNLNYNNALAVTDFTVGAGGDKLDWDGMLGSWLSNWDGGNPFASGHVRLVQSGADTLLQIDTNGTVGGSQFTNLITFQNTTATSFTTDNLGYTPNGPITLGTEGDDQIISSKGTEQIYGLGGNDFISGGPGDDYVDGGDGDDRIAPSASANSLPATSTLLGGAGIDTLDLSSRGSLASTVTFSLERQGQVQNIDIRATVIASGFENVIGSNGSLVRNVLTGNAEANILTGGRYDDQLFGKGGNDTLYGADGNDTLDGGDGNDTLDGGNGNDQLYGQADNDTMLGGDGDDFMDGGAGIDQLFGQDGNDTLLGQAGADFLDGGAGDDVMDGGAGADTLLGGAGRDIMQGGGDNDLLNGGAGDDTMDGGAGINTVTYDDAVSGVTVTLLQPGVAQDTIGSGIDTLLNIQNLTGSAFNDTLIGDNNANVLMGLAGDDTLISGRGNDQLYGGTGYDIAKFAFASTEAIISFQGGAIVVDLDGTHVLREIERVDFTNGTFDVRYNGQLASQMRTEIQGTANADTLTGGQSWDRLFGNGGNDRLIGGEGNDLLDGGAGVDTAVYGGLLRSYQTSLTQVIGAYTGSDTLVSIENQSFIDGRLTFDENDPAAALYRLYDATLDRGPDNLGFLSWLRELERGTTLNQAAAAFVTSPEFVGRYGNLSNQAFVEQLYRFCLNREGDAPGVASWVAALDAGTSRADLVLTFSESAEHRVLSYPTLNGGIWIQDDQTMAIARLYDATFDRLPDAQGLENWRAALAGGTTLAQAAVAFAGSQEFQNKYGNLSNQTYVEQLYRFTLDREGDAQGISDWVAYLNNGGSRPALLLLFSESAEHIKLTQPMWERGITYLGTDVSATTADQPLTQNADLFAASAVTPETELPGDDVIFGVTHNPHDFSLHSGLQGGDIWLVT